MAYSGSDLLIEARKLIDKRIEKGGVAHPDWVATELFREHKAAFEDALHQRFCPEMPRKNFSLDLEEFGFFSLSAQKWTRETVTKALKHYDCKLEEATDPQLVLPGYEYLQRAYSVSRGGENVIVPIDHLTDAEIDARADELDAMATGAAKHAEELRKYKRRRRRLTAA
jgi:hypothetical protein